ncbi:MAG: helix-turn-helix transcriptional regulator [Lachnoclostridium sp.]|nr:helix-turn-helix transcriptional regulator [Lachnoclostridium sp.]
MNAYDRTYDFCDSLPYLLCRRDVTVTSPFSYEAAGLDAFCLIHTKKGFGKLFYYDNTSVSYELASDTLAFIDCRKHHKLICLSNIWEYTICFVSTPVSCYYYQRLLSSGGCIFSLQEDRDSLSLWEHFLKIQENDEIHALMRVRELTALYTQLCLTRFRAELGSYHIPAYLLDMKKCFDTAYQEQYSLNALAAKYQVNKFTLGRQFAKYFEDTPLQYLNKVRIEKAKELLLSSDEKIVSIGLAVGIENTNHFIRLFKEKTGISPSAYRRETPIL